MKNLRIICWIAAGYYALQTFGFLSAGFISGKMDHMIPGPQQNAITHMQQDMLRSMQTFAPYLLIGVAVCLPLALRLKQLWGLVPIAAISLFIGGIAWIIAYMKSIPPVVLDGMMGGDVPEAFKSWMQFCMSLSKGAVAMPVLLPAVLLFIFWIRARSKGEVPVAAA